MLLPFHGPRHHHIATWHFDLFITVAFPPIVKDNRDAFGFIDPHSISHGLIFAVLVYGLWGMKSGGSS